MVQKEVYDKEFKFLAEASIFFAAIRRKSAKN